MIIYGIAAQQSVPQLFLAIRPRHPDWNRLVDLCGVVCAQARYSDHAATQLEEHPRLEQGSDLAALAPAVIFGGIYGGFFTPTEAAGVACKNAVTHVVKACITIGGKKCVPELCT